MSFWLSTNRRNQGLAIHDLQQNVGEVEAEHVAEFLVKECLSCDSRFEHHLSWLSRAWDSLNRITERRQATWASILGKQVRSADVQDKASTDNLVRLLTYLQLMSREYAFSPLLDLSNPDYVTSGFLESLYKMGGTEKMPPELKSACIHMTHNKPIFTQISELSPDLNAEICQSLVGKMEAKQSVADLQAHLVSLESRWQKETILKNFNYSLFFTGHSSFTSLETIIAKYHQLYADYFFSADKEQKKIFVRIILESTQAVFGVYPSQLKQTISLFLVRLVVPPTAAASWLITKSIESVKAADGEKQKLWVIDSQVSTLQEIQDMFRARTEEGAAKYVEAQDTDKPARKEKLSGVVRQECQFVLSTIWQMICNVTAKEDQQVVFSRVKYLLQNQGGVLRAGCQKETQALISDIKAKLKGSPAGDLFVNLTSE